MNKYTSNRSKGYVLKVDHEYPKELTELQNNYALAPGKIEIKREMLFDYQLEIVDLYNIPIGNAQKFVPNFFDKEKYVIQYNNLQLYLGLGPKLNKHIAYYNSINLNGQNQMLNSIHKKRIEAEKKS